MRSLHAEAVWKIQHRILHSCLKAAVFRTDGEGQLILPRRIGHMPAQNGSAAERRKGISGECRQADLRMLTAAFAGRRENNGPGYSWKKGSSFCSGGNEQRYGPEVQKAGQQKNRRTGSSRKAMQESGGKPENLQHLPERAKQRENPPADSGAV